MADMRAATLKLVLEGLQPALKSIDALKISLKSLTKTKQSVGIEADATKAFETISSLGKTLEDVGATSTQSSSTITRSLEAVEKSAKGVADSIKSVTSGMKALIATGSATAMGGIYVATGLEQNISEIRSLGKEYGYSTKAAEDYINTISTIPGLSKVEKANLMRDLMSTGMTPEDASKRIDIAAEALRRNPETLAAYGIKNIRDFMYADEKTLGKAGYEIPGTFTREQWDRAELQAQSQFKGNYNAPGYNDARKQYLEQIITSDAVNKILEKQGDVALTTKNRWDLLNNSLQNVTANIGTVLLPVMDALLIVGAQVANSMSPLATTIVAIGAGALVAGGAVLVLAGQIANGVSAIAGFVGWMAKMNVVKYASAAADLAIAAATKVAAAGQWLLNIAMSANPIGIMIVGAAALIGVLYLLAKHFGIVQKATDWISNFDLSEAIDGVKNFVSGMTGGSLGKMALTMLFPPILLGKLLDPILAPLLEMVGISGGIYGVIDSIYSLLKRVLMWVYDGITSLIKTITDYLKPIVDKISEFLGGGTTGGVASAGAGAPALVGDEALAALEEYNKTLPEDMKMSAEFMKQEATGMTNYVIRDATDRRKILESVWSNTKPEGAGWEMQPYTADENVLKDVERLLRHTTKDSLTSTGNDIVNSVGGVLSEIDNKTGNFGSAAYNYISNLPFDENIVGSGGAATGGDILTDGVTKLHQGEKVLTANEVQRGAGTQGMTFNANFNINGVSYSSLDKMKLKAEIEGWIRTMTDQGMTLRTRRGIA